MKEALKLALEMVQNKMYAHAEMYLQETLAQPEQPAQPELGETPLTQDEFDRWFDALPWHLRARWPTQPAPVQQEPKLPEFYAALEFIESINLGSRSASVEQQRKAITAIKEALAQRKPLTDEMVSLIAHNTDPGDWNNLNLKDSWHCGFKQGFKTAEIEYGVKHE